MDTKIRCRWANSSAEMQFYHDKEWNVLVDDDSRFLEFLCIEIMQAGLSFESVIQKRNGLNDAFNNFNPCKVADYDEKKIDELMHDDRIIRNQKKIESIIYNAGMFLKIIAEYDSFLKWFEKSKRLTLDENVILFKKHFKFVGPEIVGEFLESSGLVEKEHDKECFMHPNNTLIKKRKP